MLCSVVAYLLLIIVELLPIRNQIRFYSAIIDFINYVFDSRPLSHKLLFDRQQQRRQRRLRRQQQQQWKYKHQMFWHLWCIFHSISQLRVLFGFCKQSNILCSFVESLLSCTIFPPQRNEVLRSYSVLFLCVHESKQRERDRQLNNDIDKSPIWKIEWLSYGAKFVRI